MSKKIITSNAVKTSGKANKTHRTAADVHSEAIKLGLEVHRTGEVLHKTVSEAEPMEYAWGCAFGHGLAIDAVNAIRLNAELGYSAEEGVDSLLRDAFKNLACATTLNGRDRKGLAVGVIHTISALAAQVIERGDALALADGLHAEAVELAVSEDVEKAQRMKARAMAKRASRIAKTGPQAN